MTKIKFLMLLSRTILGVYIFLFTAQLVWGTETPEESPAFIVNAIVHTPSSFEKISNVEKYRSRVDKLPFYIEKKENTKYPCRGRLLLDHRNILDPEEPYSMGPILGEFLEKLLLESYMGANPPKTIEEISSKVKVGLLLNRMVSLDREANQEFYNLQYDIENPLMCLVEKVLWEPQWKERVPGKTRSNEHDHQNVSFRKVRKYYQKLKRKDPDLARAFIQINEYQDLNSIVPYRELRGYLLHHRLTKSLVRKTRKEYPDAPVYLSFMDADTRSFQRDDIGVFQAYEEEILRSIDPIHVITSGYWISTNQHPHVSLSVSLCMATRCSLATIFPLAPYYPEPNTAISILKHKNTLEIPIQRKLDQFSKYSSPQEIPLMIDEIIKSRFNSSYIEAALVCRFIDNGAIETEMPYRFLCNKKKKNGSRNKKVFTGKFNPEFQKISGVILQDIINIRNTSQSHLKPKEWGGYVYKYLKETEKLGSIKIISQKKPSSIISKRKDQILKSLFASVYSSHSPVAQLIKGVKENSYSLVNYLFYLVTPEYNDKFPSSIEITYGKSASTKNTGRILKKNIQNMEDMKKMIDLFYMTSHGSLIIEAASRCGKSEIPVLKRYLQISYQPKVSENIKEMRVVSNVEPNIENLKTVLNILNEKLEVKFSEIDRFADVNKGNTSRIARNAKNYSKNAKKIWESLSTDNWELILAELSLKLDVVMDVFNIPDSQIGGYQSSSTFLDFLYYSERD